MNYDPFRVAACLGGLALSAAGVAAVFTTDNGTGAAALVTVGAASIVIAAAWDRVQSFGVGSATVTLRAAELLTKSQNAFERGDVATGERLRDDATKLLERAADVGRMYESVRGSLPGGAERTAALEAVVSTARSLAPTAQRDDIARLFALGQDGSRVAALAMMQARPDLADEEIVLESIERPRSAFEQYHALLVGQSIAPQLHSDAAERLRSAVDRQLGAAFPPDGDRGTLARAILNGTAMT